MTWLLCIEETWPVSHRQLGYYRLSLQVVGHPNLRSQQKIDLVPSPTQPAEYRLFAHQCHSDTNTFLDIAELHYSWKVAIVAFSVSCEVSKQCSNFAARHFAEDGRYPVPQTAIVLAVELVKLAMVSAVFAASGEGKLRNGHHQN